MAKTQDKQGKEKRAAEKKTPAKKVTIKVVRKNPNPNQKRGQPTAAARVISSPYIKFGWHRPLSGEVKAAVQRVSSMADSMYMLQMERERPIESLSLRNGLFWEQRQLINNDKTVSTPAIDHIDLFPHDDSSFEDTLHKIGKQWLAAHYSYSLHYIFNKMRLREFLLLPVEVDGHWVTVIARMRQKLDVMISPPDFDWEQGPVEYADREVTDLAIVDPLPSSRDKRRDLIRSRLVPILAQGCIELSTEVTFRDIAVPNIGRTVNHRWKAGLVAYAISREFLRRLKVLQWRRDQGVSESDFLWAPFEEHYNFDVYRQNLTSACAHQCIEMSSFQVRMALDVPSEDSNFHPGSLSHIADDYFFQQDEKWEVFQSPTHTFNVFVGTGPSRGDSPSFDGLSDFEPQSSDFSPCEEEIHVQTGEQNHSPCEEVIHVQTGEQDHAPVSPASLSLHEEKGTSSSLPIVVEPEETAPSLREAESAGDVPVYTDFGEDQQLPPAGTNRQNNTPDAPMGAYEFSSQIPGLSLTTTTVVKSEEVVAHTQGIWHKRPLSEVEGEDYDEDYGDEVSAAKRIRLG
ncbi:hypothetical protein F5B17DRAFT_218752 [Nemania serpens]|nr:hypothetical protein F5B17DRAFT_218752 [Nemania serpens]